MEVPNMRCDDQSAQHRELLAICRAFDKKPSEVLGSIDF
jgi:hypothetical protein